jgi:radical SAM protein with 4Fe4S-binding SPASM domain
MNISYSVGIGETKEKKANDLFKNMGDHKYLMKYYIYPFMRVGNAEKLPADIFFEYDETDKLVCNDNGLITVMYNGNVYPCCSQAVFDTALKIGNIKESTLSQILESDVTKMFFRILKDKKEFSKLAEKSSEILGIDIPKKCTSTCEICRKIFLNKENLEALIPCIKSITEKSAVDRLLRRG